MFKKRNGEKMLAYSEDQLVKAYGMPPPDAADLWNALHPPSLITEIDERGKTLKKRRLEDVVKWPRVLTNGMPILYSDMFARVWRHDIIGEFFDIVEKSGGNSQAIYLVGHYSNGKTNSLYQLSVECNKRGWTVIRVDLDGCMLDDLFGMVYDVVYKVPSLKKYVEENGIPKERCFESLWVENNPESLSLGNILITIDESQSLVKKNEEKFFNCLRSIIRHRPNTYVVCSSSNFNLLGTLCGSAFDAPFLEDHIVCRYFVPDQIKKLTLQLQGRGDYKIEFNHELALYIVHTIESHTKGHPGLVGYYLNEVVNVLSAVRNDELPLDSLEDYIRKCFEVEIWNILDTCKLKKRMSRHVADGYIRKEVLYSLFANEKLLHQENNKDMNNLLLVGIAKLVSGYISLSCPVMERFYFLSVQAITNGSIAEFEEEGNLNLVALMKHVMLNTDYSHLSDKNEQLLWRKENIRDKRIYPSERNYQNYWFQYLSAICKNTYYTVVFEHNTKHAVDLSIKYCHFDTIKIYQIELLANKDNGKISDSVSNHHHKELKSEKSLVVAIVNTDWNCTDWWPDEINGEVKLIYFVHIWNEEEGSFKEIEIREETDKFPL
eukprot:TRINITY_DN274_c0_g2_i3.p1 TRINITY_DN274_c0_g2~~TRINITY_DN274_c0_g2_i3.p1  ORF type:complete len:692 (-),score=105.73 TRINITY_DN274_c0_g2_i3:12-1826(-)